VFFHRNQLQLFPLPHLIPSHLFGQKVEKKKKKNKKKQLRFAEKKIISSFVGVMREVCDWEVLDAEMPKYSPNHNAKQCKMTRKRKEKKKKKKSKIK
jgi:hypothetical protein